MYHWVKLSNHSHTSIDLTAIEMPAYLSAPLDGPTGGLAMGGLDTVTLPWVALGLGSPVLG